MADTSLLNPILDLCGRLQHRILAGGQTVGKTKELIGQEISFVSRSPSHFPELDDLDRWTKQIQDYYGDRWDRRFKAEEFHYLQLKYSLLHKVEETEYFFHCGPENRKTIIFSGDCISSVQYLKRDKASTLLVMMRSSDVVELLPMDLLYLTKIQRDLNDHYYPGSVNTERVKILLGSAHIYREGGRQ